MTAGREVRKTVTLLFIDVVGSTHLGEALDAESLSGLMNQYFRRARQIIEHHGGRVEKFIGDAVMAVFGVPVAHEDDALRAARAAVEIRDALSDLNDGLGPAWGVSFAVRTGVNTGEVLVRDPRRDESFVIGDAVNIAARLEQAAGAGEILIGPTTARLVRGRAVLDSAVPMNLKGRTEKVEVTRLVDVLPEPAVQDTTYESPLLSRDLELQQLTQAFDRVVREESCWLVTVVAAAGLGKTRLAHAFASSISRGTVLWARCPPYGESVTFIPVAEMVGQLVGAKGAAGLRRLLGEHRDAEQIAAKVSEVISEESPELQIEEVHWAIRKLLEQVAREVPVVVILDDVQWAGEAILDLIDYLADWVSAPVLLLCLARPELLETRPTWAGGKARAITTTLGPLDPTGARCLIEHLIGELALHTIALSPARLVEAAEGNPLFIEQMLVAAQEEQNGGCEGSLGIPSTIHALLTARLDALSAEEREVIDCASLVGTTFSYDAIAALVPDDVRAHLGAHLIALARRQLIASARLNGEEGFKFLHTLVRDVAYQCLARRDRARLHEVLAEWLTARPRTAAWGEVVALHLEQAHRYRVELKLLDETTARLGLAAAALLVRTARQAEARGDIKSASDLFARAIRLIPAERRSGARIRLEASECEQELGRLDVCEDLLRQALTGARAVGDSRLETRADVSLRLLKIRLDPTGQTSRKRLQEVLSLVLGGEGVTSVELHRMAATTYIAQGRLGLAEREFEAAIAQTRGARSKRREQDFLPGLCDVLLWGPAPVSGGISRTRDLLKRLTGNRRLHAVATASFAALNAIRGDIEQGRRLCAASRAVLEELGLPSALIMVANRSGLIELLAGDPAAAEAEFRRSYEALVAIGDRWYRPTVAVLLTRALLAQGLTREATELNEESEALALPDDVLTQLGWRSIRARLLAESGSLEEAERHAAEAVALAQTTDLLRHQAEVFIDQAIVLAAAGRIGSATRAVDFAIAALEQKGALRDLESATSLRRSLV